MSEGKREQEEKEKKKRKADTSSFDDRTARVKHTVVFDMICEQQNRKREAWQKTAEAKE